MIRAIQRFVEEARVLNIHGVPHPLTYTQKTHVSHAIVPGNYSFLGKRQSGVTTTLAHIYAFFKEQGKKVLYVMPEIAALQDVTCRNIKTFSDIDLIFAPYCNMTDEDLAEYDVIIVDDPQHVTRNTEGDFKLPAILDRLGKLDVKIVTGATVDDEAFHG